MQLAYRAGATVIAAVRSASDGPVVADAGAQHVVTIDQDFTERVRAIAPNGVHHVVEVVFGANITTDVEVLIVGGTIATYATDVPGPEVPFWPLAFKNIGISFLGSDDFTADAKVAAARAATAALEAGWSGLEISERIPLSDIATAHERVERPERHGRVVVTL